MEMQIYHIIIILFLNFLYARCSIRLVLLSEYDQPELISWFGDALKNYELRHSGLDISDDLIQFKRGEDEENYNKLCSSLSNGVSLLFDFTWSDWDADKKVLGQSDVPYIKSQVGNIFTVLDALLDVLNARNSSDVVIIFQTETDLNQALYNIINKSTMKILVLVGLNEENRESIRSLRPIPGHFVIVGESDFVQETYKIANKSDLLQLSDRWVLAFTDANFEKFDTSILQPNTTFLSITHSVSCRLQDSKDACSIERDFHIQSNLMNKIIEEALNSLIKIINVQTHDPTKVDCEQISNSISDNSIKRDLVEELSKQFDSTTSVLVWDNERNGLYFKGSYNAKFGNSTYIEDLAEWSTGDSFSLKPGAEIVPIRLFYRVGVAEAMPWVYRKIDPVTGLAMYDGKGNPMFEGYCIDLIQRVAELMNFDYEIVPPRSGRFGKKLPNGTWTGIIGDLIRGDTDMAISATIMTSEREEVVDFVAPYFDTTGISIVIRKPIRKTSLFKFMTVLKVEVWLSIIAAVIVTGLLLSLLDRYSPYSARNNRDVYDESIRNFTLKESFWFTLTSFTPQGGGEAPKSLSGRTLVAAYWLFVVLMLATFTANLAAFLTVERMQTPVASLEQLAKQSRINYTVVEGSMAHKYFKNMKNAEDILYKFWKELVLNSSSDESIYHVWDYPIKEQYGRILLAIEAAVPVKSAEEGFAKVNDHLDADFAFIHDAAEIKYELSRNCNITEVGEVFGERPYAMMIQQGSRIQDDMSKTTLELQRTRYFEYLTSKYWNESLKGDCMDDDESEGISLQSLGGVFIATLCGLGLAMITLIGEIIYYKRLETKVKTFTGSPEKKPEAVDNNILKSKNENKELFRRNITIGDTFKPVVEKTKVSHIDVEPRIGWNP